MARKQAKRRKPRKTRSWKPVRIPLAALSRLAIAIAVIGLSYEVGARLLDKPIRAITIDGPFQRVTALQIEEAVGAQLADGFLSADLSEIHDRVTGLVWIDKASVSRRWPATIEIQVTEQVPAARWGDSGLLNTRGELFVTDVRHVPAELPRLSGPGNRSAEVAETYLELRDRLIPMGLDLREVEMDARGAWMFLLQNGVKVRLGRREVENRLDLFLDVVANFVSSREADISFVDMRYSNGFTIGWADDETPTPRDEIEQTADEMVAGSSGLMSNEGVAE